MEIIGDIIWTAFQIGAACAAVFGMYLTAALTVEWFRTRKARRALRASLRRRTPYDWKTRS
jgi:hypothetical protein